MDTVIERFLKATDKKGQIVVLGAGSDTTFLRLKQAGNAPHMFVEVDLPGVVSKKLTVIKSDENVCQLLGVTKEQVQQAQSSVGEMLLGSEYALARVDLRNLDLLESVLDHLERFDFDRPTLFISECVLCYVAPSHSGKLLKWMTEKFKSVAFTAYEQILPHDAFGKTMLGHFRTRGCPLLSIDTFPDLDAQRKRFSDLGWSKCQVLDMNDVYYKCIDKGRLKEAEKLEIFDEFEEWHMMQGHYCVALAVNDKSNAKILSDVKLS